LPDARLQASGRLDQCRVLRHDRVHSIRHVRMPTSGDPVTFRHERLAACADAKIVSTPRCVSRMRALTSLTRGLDLAGDGPLKGYTSQ
jgi:hypothetical protein